jgi:hypothetical protein
MAHTTAAAARMILLSEDGELPELVKALKISLAIVQMEKDESQEQAWRRHVKDHPADKMATVKVFNYNF